METECFLLGQGRTENSLGGGGGNKESCPKSTFFRFSKWSGFSLAALPSPPSYLGTSMH